MNKKVPKSEFIAKLEKNWQKGNFVCVGLDPEYSQLPIKYLPHTSVSAKVFEFNKSIIEATADLVCAFKPNFAFYEVLGEEGLRALKLTVNFIKKNYPEIPIILDAKRGDIENTNISYANSAFNQIGVDAITVSPYLGKEALAPFLKRKDKGVIILAKTSNPGASELQNLKIQSSKSKKNLFLYQYIAQKVALEWNTNGNCGLVVGATFPKELADVRQIVGNLPILIPGIGSQGGKINTTVLAGKDSRGWGMIISASRSIIFASSKKDYPQAAREATSQLGQTIKRALVKNHQ